MSGLGLVLVRLNNQAVKRRPGLILEGHGMTEDDTRQANLEAAC